MDDREFREQAETLDLAVYLLREFHVQVFLAALRERAGALGGERLRRLAQAVEQLQRAAVAL